MPNARLRQFIARFNRHDFFAAHDILEPLWLESRQTSQADFYKGLIQLAGAFIHLQHGRLAPARALLRRSAELLRPYAPEREHLDVAAVLRWIESRLSAPAPPPQLLLRKPRAAAPRQPSRQLPKSQAR